MPGTGAKRSDSMQANRYDLAIRVGIPYMDADKLAVDSQLIVARHRSSSSMLFRKRSGNTLTQKNCRPLSRPHLQFRNARSGYDVPRRPYHPSTILDTVSRPAFS